MSGGAMGVGGEGSPLGGGAEAPTSTTSTGAYTPTAPQSTAPSSYWSSMVTPNTAAENIASIYQQSLGRAPKAEGAQYWSDQAARQGWTGQQLAQAIQTAGAPERAQTGFQSQLNPSTYGQQALNRPSYYNTNPVGVDYANIFNPAARSVTYNQPTGTPQQQAQYLGDWARHYSQSNRAATEAANAERIKTANTQWANYLDNKAKAEASNQDAINKAVQEALAQQQTSNSLFKAGGNVGIRGIK